MSRAAEITAYRAKPDFNVVNRSRISAEAAALCIAKGIPQAEWPDVARGIGTIYFMHSQRMKAIKIGFSFTLGKRTSTLQTGSAEKLILLGQIPGTLAHEKELHKQFARTRLNGEWFKATKRLLAFIAENAEMP